MMLARSFLSIEEYEHLKIQKGKLLRPFESVDEPGGLSCSRRHLRVRRWLREVQGVRDHPLPIRDLRKPDKTH